MITAYMHYVHTLLTGENDGAFGDETINPVVTLAISASFEVSEGVGEGICTCEKSFNASL